MSCQVRWLVFLRLNSARKVNRLLDRFAEAVGQKVVVRECERYWKDPTLFRAVVTCQLPAKDLSSAIVAVLQMCWRLGRSWTLGTPQLYEGARWEFFGSAVSPSIGIMGLKEIQFQAGNWEHSLTVIVPQAVVQNEADTTVP